MASVGVAILLTAAKAWAWWLSGSIAMLAALADSTLDLAASLFTLFAVGYASTPPDSDHRFGHGKAEAFAGLMQAGLVTLSGILIGIEALQHIVDPQPITGGWISITVLVFAISVTLGLVVVQSRAIRRTGSVATRADRLHYAGDLLSNAVAACGVAAGAFFNLPMLDAGAGLFIMIWLVVGAYGVARESANQLLDREIEEDQRLRMRALAEADPRVRGVHDMRTRISGPYMHVQFHADLDPALTLEAAHHIIVAAEERIRAEFPTADVIIHPDPRGRAEPHGHEDFEPRQSEA